jgi:hypothetical protein
MLISTTKAKKLLKDLLLAQPIGKQILALEIPELSSFIYSLPKFVRHHGQPFTIDLKAGRGGRRVRCLCIQTLQSKTLLPVFATSLAPKKATSEPRNQRSRVLQAMRDAISDQIFEFRCSDKALVCALTGLRLLKGYHVDHFEKPFIQLADEFVTHSQLSGYKDLRLNRAGQLKEPYLARWQDFHLKFAKLQKTNAKANISKSSSGYKSIY